MKDVLKLKRYFTPEYGYGEKLNKYTVSKNFITIVLKYY